MKGLPCLSGSFTLIFLLDRKFLKMWTSTTLSDWRLHVQPDKKQTRLCVPARIDWRQVQDRYLSLSLSLSLSLDLDLNLLTFSECSVFNLQIACNSGRISKVLLFSFSDLPFSDIDECSTGQHNCDVPERGICNNTHASFLCHCRHGYCGEDGRNCKGLFHVHNILLVCFVLNHCSFLFPFRVVHGLGCQPNWSIFAFCPTLHFIDFWTNVKKQSDKRKIDANVEKGVSKGELWQSSVKVKR